MIAGIDIGSRSMELVVLDGDEIAFKRKLPTTFDPSTQIQTILEDVKLDRIAATGYGRKLVSEKLTGCECFSLTEIKAYALGVSHLYPEATDYS